MNSSANNLPSRGKTGFTLIELLVVLGILAILSTMLLPTLCRAKSQTRTTACASNFRQWAVAVNLYAKDNQDWLPSGGTASGGGGYVWNVGTNLYAMAAYGVNLPNLFCPVRPDELDALNSWAIGTNALGHPLGHPLLTLEDLQKFYRRIGYPDQFIINHNYWIPRTQGATTIPADYSKAILITPWLRDAESTKYGWPQKLHDTSTARVPFISDKCGSGNGNGLDLPPSGQIGPETANISPNTAHFSNGKLIGVNIAFADGRVEAHSKAQVRAVYTASGSTFWFY